MRVPPEFAPLFERAEEVVARFFAERRDLPEKGTIEIFGERYLLVRAASLSVEFFKLCEELFGKGREAEAADFARNILFDLAHAIGKADAQRFHAKMGLKDPIARLSAGPVHFAYTGWAFVDILPESRPIADADFCTVYDHPYSFESDAWIRAKESPAFPVCIMNAGYSSGWCEESFGLELVAAEVLCRAKGDDCCRFVMAQPARIEEMVQRYIQSTPKLAPRMQAYQIPDFFARKRLEEELRRSRSDLEKRVEERTAELRAANELLQREMKERLSVEQKLRQSQKLEAIGRLAGGIAHDFNNLLLVIGGYADLVRERLASDDPLWAYFSEIKRASDRAASLTQQLLAFSRQQVLAPQVLDLNDVVAGVGGMLRRLISENVDLVSIAERPLGRVRADRTQIEQILVNLAANARDAMRDGGRLVIETANVDAGPLDGAAVSGPHVQLSVSDSGVGMDAETLSHVFEPFYTTKERGKGTGLGLATVHGIVQQSGGTITATSAPGKGTTFRILFPRVEDPLAAAGAGEPAANGAKARGTVLLVEDEASVRLLVRRQLERSGFHVIDAPDPAKALELAESGAEVRLLITDVVMPGMPGPELARRLRSLRPDLRVILMSGYADEAAGKPGGSEPGIVFLQKPYTLGELEVKVREALA